MTADGMAADGMAADGMAADGMAADGVAADGVAADGMAADGMIINYSPDGNATEYKSVGRISRGCHFCGFTFRVCQFRG